ncbi:MAG: galactose mutarotase, partial [Pseudomonadota bacterium]
METVSAFGRLSDGRTVTQVVLNNGILEARILDFGARLVFLRLGDGPNVCSTSEHTPDFEDDLKYAGPIIAPVINRVGGARAAIAGRAFNFEPNQDGKHTLHCGANPKWHDLWRIDTASTNSAQLTLNLGDGDDGFPGKRAVRAFYALDGNGLNLTIEAETDAPTFMNPGIHGMWNVYGPSSTDAQTLTIPASTYLPVNAETLPTGEVSSVEKTAYDHRHGAVPDPTLDHNFCFAPEFGLRAKLAGASGYRLEIQSDAPGDR